MRVNRPTLWKVTRMTRGMAKAGIDGATQIAEFSPSPIKNIVNFLETRKLCREKFGTFLA